MKWAFAFSGDVFPSIVVIEEIGTDYIVVVFLVKYFKCGT
jgi:hypothetical protein